MFDCIGNRKIGSKTILIQQQDIRTIQMVKQPLIDNFLKTPFEMELGRTTG